jgi:hypothetical protein
LDCFDECGHPQSDIARGQSETGFEVVGPKHQDNEVKGLMRFQTGLQIHPAISGSFQRIVMDGGSSTLALFDDVKTGAQLIP